MSERKKMPTKSESKKEGRRKIVEEKELKKLIIYFETVPIIP